MISLSIHFKCIHLFSWKTFLKDYDVSSAYIENFPLESKKTQKTQKAQKYRKYRKYRTRWDDIRAFRAFRAFRSEFSFYTIDIGVCLRKFGKLGELGKLATLGKNKCCPSFPNFPFQDFVLHYRKQGVLTSTRKAPTTFHLVQSF